MNMFTIQNISVLDGVDPSVCRFRGCQWILYREYPIFGTALERARHILVNVEYTIYLLSFHGPQVLPMIFSKCSLWCFVVDIPYDVRLALIMMFGGYCK